MHRLKIVRVLLGVSTFCLITVYFLDFTGRTPAILHFLPRIQWVPALLSVTPVLSGLFLLSLFFGRLYCSAICPLGIFQDLLIRIFKQIQKPQKVKYHYRKPAGVLRYSILALTLLSFFSGSMGVLILLDPYSNFGRMLSGVFRPVFLLLNNILARIFHAFEWYSIPVYPVEITGLTILSVGSGILILLILVLFTVRHGRMYCNTICPVGTFLGMMAKISLFRLTIDKVECTGCGVCGTVCKGECIDSKHQTIDVSRCVTCFNCLKICRKNAVKYKFVLPSSVKKTSPAYMNESRRKALRFSGVLLGSFVAQRAASAIQTKSADPAASRRVILPPGAVSKDQFNKKCTGCQLCVTKCPSHVLQPATLQYGFGGILQPHLVYRHGYCNYNCTLCSEVCPTQALKPLSVAEKKVTQVGIAQFRPELCIVPTQHADCGACAEHCPTQAVRMIPYKDGLTIPSLDQSLCIGCGGCEFICPVRPFQAIYVEGEFFHHTACAPADAELFEEKVDDFGF